MSGGAKHSVKVSILNEELTIRSDSPPEHTKAVAQYLDQAIRQVMTGGSALESHRAVVLAALRVTGELFDERKASEELTSAITALSDDVRPWLPPAKRKTEKDDGR
jgi:cell division protein ZapA